MAYFFPAYLNSTPYAALYAELSAVERGMVLREFIGVTYRNRFRFFQRHDYHRYYAAPFRHNLMVAAARQEKRKRICKRIWNKKSILVPYLRMVYRHYALGFAVLLLRRHHSDILPPAEPGCYPDAVDVLDALQWFLEHQNEVLAGIDACIDEVVAGNTRSLYIYCLQSMHVVRRVMMHSGPGLSRRRQVKAACIGGSVPLGAELEFSNLGYKASFEHAFGRHHRDPLFHNFIYFHHFHLGDLSWRLGGYLDHHVRLRRYLPLPWIGGFFEYALVRMDYPRRFSLPLTCDPGFLALYVNSVTRFVPEIEPHSLHLNVEVLWPNATSTPALDDFKCLLLLGGDLRKDEDGKIREQRLCHHELMKVVRQRYHLSLFDHQRHTVNEYAFLRLRKDLDVGAWKNIVLAIKGFNAVSTVGEKGQEPINELAFWARRPEALTLERIEMFISRVRHGLELEGAYSPGELNQYMADLQAQLQRENQRLQY